MKLLSSQPENPRNQRLMWQGFAVTGLGLLGLMAAAVLLIEGAGKSLVMLAVLAIAGLLVTGVGFGMMVVAADPFAECETDSDPGA